MDNDKDKLGFAFQNAKLMKNTCRRSNSAQEQLYLTSRKGMQHFLGLLSDLECFGNFWFNPQCTGPNAQCPPDA